MWLWLVCCHFTALAVSKQMTGIAVVFKSTLVFSPGFFSQVVKFPSCYLQSSRGPGSLSGHAVLLFPKVSTTEMLLKN